ncbi:MAG: translational GTPase TypA [Actinomycetota bacterium]|nr:translational GTPase TypA [Actinomycetota bacterium]MED5293219.1 translational GTPase TypA [Actinomycetota bacterium]
MTASEPDKTRADLRNVAIIAHVDHGKTTLVDAMLWQSGAFRDNEEVQERVLDSMDLEREKGITILAKNTAVRWRDQADREIKINIIDTPGHADFGGEVERALTMVDGVVLLVDASEGPLPQTRFVLRKALALDLPVVLVINKIDRPDGRISEVIDETYELFLDLDAKDHQIDFPIVYTDARKGTATTSLESPGQNLEALFEVLVDSVPSPTYISDHPLQAWVTTLDANPYVGRIAICRVLHGTLRRGEEVAWCRVDGSIERTRVTELYTTEGLHRVDVDEVGPGEIAAVAGIPEITIGETLSEPVSPTPLPVITVDEPSLSMTIGINTSPLAGTEGKKMTARLIKNRLETELIGNVSLRLHDTDRPDAWEIQGRGELQLAVLVEIMRREGFELTVGKPQVLTKTIDGALHEPAERVTIDIPEDHVGAVTQLLGERRGRLEQMTNHGTGWVRLDYLIPARGLIGFRTEFLTETRGTGLLHHVFDSYVPWSGDIRSRHTGSIVADRLGQVSGYAASAIQDRGSLFVGPSVSVYQGMVIGENPRPDDLDVNICKEKKQTNIRAAAADDAVRLSPPRILSLEHALEFIADDECVEVTPESIRIRKVELDPGIRLRTKKRAQA